VNVTVKNWRPGSPFLPADKSNYPENKLPAGYFSFSEVSRLIRITLAYYYSPSMQSIELQLNEKGRGAFFYSEQDKRLGEMEISVSGNHLTVYHTEVVPEMEGKGVAKQLLAAMVDHARTHRLKVIPLCPYVLAQFKRHPDEYADVWEK